MLSRASYQDFSQEKMHLVMNAGPGGVGDRYEGTATMMIEAAHCLLENEDAGSSSGRYCVQLRVTFNVPVLLIARWPFFYIDSLICGFFMPPSLIAVYLWLLAAPISSNTRRQTSQWLGHTSVPLGSP